LYIIDELIKIIECEQDKEIKNIKIFGDIRKNLKKFKNN